MLDRQDREIDEAISGQSRRGTEARFGSKADSGTAQDVHKLVEKQLENALALTIRRDIVAVLVEARYGPQFLHLCPKISLSATAEQDFATDAAAVASLQTSGYFAPSQYQDLDKKLGLPMRTEAEQQMEAQQQDAQLQQAINPPAPIVPGQNKPGKKKESKPRTANMSKGKSFLQKIIARLLASETATFDDSGIQWITVHGSAVPIQPGESKGAAISKFLTARAAATAEARKSAPKKEKVADTPEQTATKDAAKAEKQKVNDERSVRVMGKLSGIHAGIPKLQSAIAFDLKKDGLTKERVGAVVSAIIDRTTMRVGSEEFATKSTTGNGLVNEKSQDSFGASSLRKSHVTVEGDTVTMTFPGKSRKDWSRSVTDPHLAKAVKELQSLPGERLMQYQDSGGKVRSFNETHTRDYMAPHGITPKNIRTHHATEHADRFLSALPNPTNAKQAEKDISDAAESTSQLLGNTPAIARQSYINPAVLHMHRARFTGE
jgi:hypothetical protein